MDWYYAKFGKQEGPIDSETLRAKVDSGEVAPTDLVWHEGMGEWEPAEKVPELSGAAPASGVPSATPSAVPSGVPNAGGSMVQPSPGVAVYTPAPTSGLAIASLVCGIIGIFLCYIHAVCALPAVICGHMALKQINQSATPTGGRGMAIAGLVCGYIGLVLQLLTIGVIVFVVINEGM